MDWNNDGKVDFQDHALFHNVIMNEEKGSSGGGGGGGSSGGGCDIGCLGWALAAIVIFKLFSWIIGAFG